MKFLKEKIAEDLYLLRVGDEETRYFEALWEIPEGITYNAYLLETKEGDVLIDGWKEAYAGTLLEMLRESLDRIKMIVVNHAEPDHTGSMKKVLEACKSRPLVVGTKMAGDLLKHFYKIDFNFKPVGDGEEIKYGGYTLKFITTPWLHWPETMTTYIAELKTLFTCDIFGGYGINDAIYAEDIELGKYLDLVKKYTSTVIGTYKAHIVKNIEKIKKLGLDIKVIAPGHGMLWRDARKIMDYYYDIGNGSLRHKKVAMIYDSMYGFIESAMLFVKDLIEENGYEIKEFKFTDRERPLISDVVSEVTDSSLVVLGISTYENHMFPLMEYLLNILSKKVNNDIAIIIITSYGWGPIVRTLVANALKGTRFKLLGVVEFRGSYDQEHEEKIKDLLEKALLQ
ncbi:MAG: FprA family A-type flavoprotein [Caldisphaeraceae archaeon]|nr:FprA family A-type flavoprotein [Caldisphaeraceae archaeon]